MKGSMMKTATFKVDDYISNVNAHEPISPTPKNFLVSDESGSSNLKYHDAVTWSAEDDDDDAEEEDDEFDDVLDGEEESDDNVTARQSMESDRSNIEDTTQGGHGNGADSPSHNNGDGEEPEPSSTIPCNSMFIHPSTFLIVYGFFKK